MDSQFLVPTSLLSQDDLSFNQFMDMCYLRPSSLKKIYACFPSLKHEAFICDLKALPYENVIQFGKRSNIINIPLQLFKNIFLQRNVFPPKNYIFGLQLFLCSFYWSCKSSTCVDLPFVLTHFRVAAFNFGLFLQPINFYGFDSVYNLLMRKTPYVHSSKFLVNNYCIVSGEAIVSGNDQELQNAVVNSFGFSELSLS